MAATTTQRTVEWRVEIETVARRLAAITAAGALLGLLVGGLGGRLAMLVLAMLNPSAAGVTSDDGFSIGQFTLAGTLNLFLVGAVLGVLGAAIYTVLRPLMIGPRWFQVLSIGAGPAVVVGEQLVHVDGVDFTLLTPASLAIAMFVLIPCVYSSLLTVLAERWLAPDRFFSHGRLPLALLPLLAFGPLAPLLVVLGVSWLLVELVRRRCHGVVPRARAVAWSGRAALAVLFGLSLAELVRETLILT